MMLSDYDSLKEILDELRQEAAEIDGQIKDNLRCIRETEMYVKTLIKTESDDFKVFSPRRSELIHKGEIETAKEKVSGYEELNRELYRKQEVLNNRMKKIENILNRQSHYYTILNIQEEDRQRIARDLHDTSLQNLTHLIHRLELSSMYIDKDAIQAKLELSIISKRLRETIDEIRCIIYNLRPAAFDDLGFKASLECLIANINENRKYEINSKIDDIPCDNKLILLSVYRLVQESFNNIEKHAEADKINFFCKAENDKCSIVIEDNGKGFSENADNGKQHFGISIMKERVGLLNGHIEINSKPGKGTRISIVIPLKEEAE